MRLRSVRVLMLFAALWLPVQTMAAKAMPLCRHALEHAAHAVDAAQAEAHCHDAGTVDLPQVHDAGCDNCEMCHMASAGFMPSTPLASAPVPEDRHFGRAAFSTPPSHIAEPPQRPPRADA